MLNHQESKFEHYRRVQLAKRKYLALTARPEADVDWTKRSECRGMDDEIFYGATSSDVAEAKEVCVHCVVGLNCLRYAIENDEKFGVWGGLDERELRLIKKIEPICPDAPSDLSVEAWV